MKTSKVDGAKDIHASRRGTQEISRPYQGSEA